MPWRCQPDTTLRLWRDMLHALAGESLQHPPAHTPKLHPANELRLSMQKGSWSEVARTGQLPAWGTHQLGSWTLPLPQGQAWLQAHPYRQPH